MEKRKFIVGSIFGLATMLVLSAASEFLGLDIFITMLFALLALPFILSAFIVSVSTRASEGIIFSIMTQVLAIITIVLTIMDSVVKLEFYVGTLALGFITVMLLHMERTMRRRRKIAKKRMEAKAVVQAKKERKVEKITVMPEVPEKKKRNGKFVASETGLDAVVHRSSCWIAKRIKPKNKVRFETYAEALQKGYVPCKVCLKKENKK